jgi:predicted hydrolase (HD superfamily)
MSDPVTDLMEKIKDVEAAAGAAVCGKQRIDTEHAQLSREKLRLDVIEMKQLVKLRGEDSFRRGELREFMKMAIGAGRPVKEAYTIALDAVGLLDSGKQQEREENE